MLDTHYDPKVVEEGKYDGWVEKGYFTAGDKSADFNSQFAIHLWNATGTVDWADLRIEPCD